MKEYIAYKGSAFTIEWYYDAKGRSQAFEYYTRLNQSERIKVLKLFKRMGDSGVIKDITKFNYEGDQLYAFKPKPHRFLCFFYINRKILITNAFSKKQQVLPKGEKEKALKYSQNFVSRVNKGSYYE